MMKKVLYLLLAFYLLPKIVDAGIGWTTPTAISTLLKNASEPSVVIDANGNATAAWVESGTVKAARLNYGGNWSDFSTLSDALNIASSPILAIDSSGNITALWVENEVVTSAMLSIRGGWEGRVAISSSGASNPALAVDDTGNAVAVWMRNGYIESSTRISERWSTFTVLSVTAAAHPDIAISSSGIAIAVWYNEISGEDVISAARLTLSSNTWSAKQDALSGGELHYYNYPTVALDLDGNAYVAIFQYDLLDEDVYQNVQVLVSTLPSGSTDWTVPITLSDPGIRNPADLWINIMCDDDGDVLAVWTNSYDGQTFAIESNFGKFGDDNSRSGIATLYSFAFDLATASGRALQLTMGWDNTSSLIIQSQQADMMAPVLQNWTIAETVSTGSSNGYPKCAMSTAGSIFYAVAVWLSFDGANTVLHASTGVDNGIAPPTSVTAVQNVTDFGVYQDYYNTIFWEASTELNVVQYNLYRNGIFFAATDARTLHFVDHNAVKNGTVTYGVSTHSASYLLSPIVSFTLYP